MTPAEREIARVALANAATSVGPEPTAVYRILLAKALYALDERDALLRYCLECFEREAQQWCDCSGEKITLSDLYDDKNDMIAPKRIRATLGEPFTGALSPPAI